MKHRNETIGNRTRDLPARTAVSQSTALPTAPPPSDQVPILLLLLLLLSIQLGVKSSGRQVASSHTFIYVSTT